MELFGLNKNITYMLLEMLIETVPSLTIVEDLNMVLVGMKDNFEKETMLFLEKNKELLLQKANFIQEMLKEHNN